MRHWLSLMLLCLLLSASCADDLRRYDIFATTAEQVVISFSVDNVVLTRSGNQAFDDAAIDHAYFLFYPSDDFDFSGLPVAVVKAEVLDAGSLRFNMPVSLQENTSYKLMAVANADAYSPEGSDFEEFLRSNIELNNISQLSDILLKKRASITSSEVNYLPMKGTVDGGTSFRFTRNGGVVYVNMSLSFRRMVSRIDVSNIAEDFELEKVTLCNWRDAVALGDQPNHSGEIQGILTGSDSSDDDDDSSILDFVTPRSGEQNLNGDLYCFPSSNDNPALDDEATTALIIKGSYKSAPSSYYRVNLGLNENGAELYPNTKYTVNITAVNGNGFESAVAAYSATSEPQIITAVVEDWDIEGGNYVMDDDGHILGVSQTALEFEAEDIQPQQIKVLVSKDLSLSASFISDEDTPDDAFTVSLGSASALSIITISPKGPNEELTSLSGHCHISASKNGNECLYFDIPLKQQTGSGKPYIPQIPENLDYAVMPLIGPERVKIDHDNKNIEIDGFDPDCFNSFINIPFKVYVKEGSGFTANSVSTTLSWPLEGRIVKEEPEKLYYCANSFLASQPKVYSESKGETLITPNGISVSVNADDTFYISIGAMAPDDPAIVRKFSLSVKNGSNQYFNADYTITVKPRDVIIDDVVLINSENNQSWLILDRNVQDLSPYLSYKDYVGRREDNGKKRQAYNYSAIGTTMVIPCKYSNSSTSSSFNEATHLLYRGKNINAKNDYRTSINSEKISWLAKYVYQNESFVRTSPFYESSNISEWMLPSQEVLELCRSKMRVSKMRMFLVSDVSAKIDDKRIPICCYWPFHGNFNSSVDNTNTNQYGYYASDTDVPIGLIFYQPMGIIKFIPGASNLSKYYGFMRLVRQLSDDELKDYKTNFLGYGPNGCLLTPCHPDTYSSTSLGWISN